MAEAAREFLAVRVVAVRAVLTAWVVLVGVQQLVAVVVADQTGDRLVAQGPEL
jgi:hypothetical protein